MKLLTLEDVITYLGQLMTYNESIHRKMYKTRIPQEAQDRQRKLAIATRVLRLAKSVPSLAEHINEILETEAQLSLFTD